MFAAGKRGAMIAAMSMALIGGQAQAAAQGEDCWSAQEVSAARVRDLQSMLMVAALRCRNSGVDVLSVYNRFVSANRSVIANFNTTLKQHFNRTSGPVEGQRGYDRFTTALANGYGAGGGGGCNDMSDLASKASASNGSAAALISIAEQQGLDPALPVRRCGTSIATK